MSGSPSSDDKADDLSKKMSELRGELGSDFIDKFTEMYVREIIPVGMREDVRCAIERVREENYIPIVLEIEHAVQRVIVDKLQSAIESQRHIFDIENLRADLSNRRADLLEEMLRYKESAPKRNAAKGGAAKHAETSNIKARVVADWRENGRSYANRTAFAHTWLDREPRVTRMRTILDWIRGI